MPIFKITIPVSIAGCTDHYLIEASDAGAALEALPALKMRHPHTRTAEAVVWAWENATIEPASLEEFRRENARAVFERMLGALRMASRDYPNCRALRDGLSMGESISVIDTVFNFNRKPAATAKP